MSHVAKGISARRGRQARAAERQEARNERGDKAQLKVLSRRGHPHCKEVGRLNDRIAGRK